VAQRSKRLHKTPKGQFPDHRTAFQVDRDRVLYTDAFRRLGGVTQVAGPNENYQFHNRLSHSLKVAQIAERLAQRFSKVKSSDLDISVVITAALAHDLGHPPFGHVAEHELDALVKKYGNSEGYEGNAQTFRILTKLSTHQNDYSGLNLTRATLNAVLKYPWKRDLGGSQNSKKYRKFGYYDSEEDDFKFARQDFRPDSKEQGGRSLEAQIMDYADEVTYSIHDFEDFYRAGLIPVAALQRGEKEFDDFIRRWSNQESHEEILSNRAFFLATLGPLPENYGGGRDAQIALRKITSFNIGESVNRPVVDGTHLIIDKSLEWKHKFLQQMIWEYVIRNPRLASQQEGQRRIIRTLFETYQKALTSGRFDLLPTVFEAVAQKLPKQPKNIDDPKNDPRRPQIARIAADIVASLTDQQALTIYQRILGVAPGAVTDLLQ
jgi:dGTPase